MSTHTVQERLEFIAAALANALAGNHTAWSSLVALEGALPFLLPGQPKGWRAQNVDVVQRICRLTRDLTPILMDVTRDELDPDKLALGLVSVASLFEDENASHPLDRIGFMRNLMCRLAISICEAGIAERGHLLEHEMRGALGLSAASSPSSSTH